LRYLFQVVQTQTTTAYCRNTTYTTTLDDHVCNINTDIIARPKFHRDSYLGIQFKCFGVISSAFSLKCLSRDSLGTNLAAKYPSKYIEILNRLVQPTKKVLIIISKV
jgi:hypothetical protein